MKGSTWRSLRASAFTRYQPLNNLGSSEFTFKYPRYTSSSVLQTRGPVNGPITTLPAPLNPPVRESDQAAVSYYFSVGKAYLNFYKKGIKNIYYNYKASIPIKRIIKSKYGGSVTAAVAEKAISRSEFQLLVRSRHDIRRVPAFALLLLIFGEFTPLIVVAVSNIVPWTCRIPKQIENNRRKMEQLRRIAFHKDIADPPTKHGVELLNKNHLLRINSSLGLSSLLWNYVGDAPTMILRIKVQRRLEYLKLDDLLIEAAGGDREMDIEEIKMALVERGVDVLGKSESQLRCNITSWLSSRKQVPAERLLLTRPSTWPTSAQKHAKR